MNARKLRTSINIGLVVAFIGLLFTFPIKENVFGGLLFAVFSAALIGGLADSFAVKAIFGQPLNIKWPSWLGTNIVARHRERLVNELIDMVKDELLSPSSIRMALKDKKISSILQHFIQSETGEQTVKQLLHGAIKETVKGENFSFLLISLKKVASQFANESKPSKHLCVIITFIFKERIDDTIAAFIVRMLRPLLKNVELRSFVKQVVQTAIAKYEKDNRRRQVANQIANIDANQLADKLFEFADQWLFDLTDEHHALRQNIKKIALDFVVKVESDENYALKVNEKMNRIIRTMFGSLTKGDALQGFLANLELAIAADDQAHAVVKWSHEMIDKGYQSLVNTSLANYDEPMMNWVLQLVESKQEMIGNLVREKMNQYSTEELIELVEDKAGKDLQYIRMNGAVVGGLIGGILFIAQLLIGGAIS